MSLGKADLAAATDTVVYTVSTGKTASCNVNICNRNSASVRVRLAIAASATPATSEYIEYDYLLLGNQTIERTCLIVQSTEKIVARSDTTNVSVQVYGFED